jgi:uncharacterized membrane protein YgaE (UPF0421/DUF939 family)
VAIDSLTSRWGAAMLQGLAAAAVAVFCYATINLVPNLLEPYWAPIAAVVVLYPDPQATTKAAVARFLGTIIGCFIGWGAGVWWHHDVLLYGLAILFAVSLCYLLRMEAASRLAAVAVTVITLVPHEQPVHLVAFHRFVEVSYGVLCALLYTLAADLVRRRRQRSPS